MSRKKVFLSSIILSCLFLLSSCAPHVQGQSDEIEGLETIPQSDNVEIVRPQSSDYLLTAESLSDLEEQSDYIVRGVLQDDAKQKLEMNEGYAIWGVTVSHLKITDVYEGNIDIGDSIPVAERYYTKEVDGKVFRYEMDYTPSVPDKEYIFFLIKESDDNEFLKGLYTPVGREAGRFLVPAEESSISVNSIENGSEGELQLIGIDPEIYGGIYEEVIEKYLQ